MTSTAHPVSRTRIRILEIAAVVLTLLLAACGGGGDGGGDAPPPLLSISVPGQAVIKVRSGAQGIVALGEKPQAINDPLPRARKLVLLGAGAQTGQYVPPAGWSLLDFAIHPSGEISAILGTDMALRLVRLNAAGGVLHDQPLLDHEARNDPSVDLEGVTNPDSLVPAFSRDAARVAPIGEDVAVAVRTGINAAVAYRYDRTAAGFTRAWRTLVEPGMTVMGRFLTGGSHDVFDQLANHAKVLLDTDGQGRVAVAVTGGSATDLFHAHAAHFNEATGTIGNGGIVTLLSATGARLVSTAVDTAQVSELHGLRNTGNGFALVGRVRTQRLADGSGWNAFAAFISQAGELRNYSVINVDRGDVLFDLVAGRNSQLLAVGTTGYTQNPFGASISEEAAPLLLVLSDTGTVVSRLAVTAGPRHNQLRTLARHGTHWLAGGMSNGPGTHSGDVDPGLISADGVLREIAPIWP
ncbi:MAG: hypothetical protein Q8Q73_12165 [Stagnimonas sp.]|nr:hypothetical protein [Stagnimonas sp.]